MNSYCHVVYPHLHSLFPNFSRAASFMPECCIVCPSTAWSEEWWFGVSIFLLWMFCIPLCWLSLGSSGSRPCWGALGRQGAQSSRLSGLCPSFPLTSLLSAVCNLAQQRLWIPIPHPLLKDNVKLLTFFSPKNYFFPFSNCVQSHRIPRLFGRLFNFSRTLISDKLEIILVSLLHVVENTQIWES